MTGKQVASLFLKLVAVYISVRAIPSMLSLGSTLAGFQNAGFTQVIPIVIASIASLVAVLVLMYLIIRRSEWFAVHLLKADDTPVSFGSLTSIQLQSIAFSWIGLLLTADGIVGLVYQVSQLKRLAMAVGDQAGKAVVSDKIYSGVTSDAVEIAIGVFLFLFPNGLAKVWHAIQRTRPMKS